MSAPLHGKFGNGDLAVGTAVGGCAGALPGWAGCIGGAAGAGAAAGGCPFKSKRYTPLPSTAAYKCKPSPEIASALTERESNPVFVTCQEAPPSAER